MENIIWFIEKYFDACKTSDVETMQRIRLHLDDILNAAASKTILDRDDLSKLLNELKKHE